MSTTSFNWLQDERLNILLWESLKIEGIHRPPSPKERSMARRFLENTETPTIQELCLAVQVFQPNARYRGVEGVHDVRVGNHIPPKSGQDVKQQLERLYNQIRVGVTRDAHFIYCEYERIHPFTDGNGRSGRLLWLWAKIHLEKDYSLERLSFLERFHYDTLARYHG